MFQSRDHLQVIHISKLLRRANGLWGGLYVNEMFSIINWLILKGNWGAYRCNLHSISRALKLYSSSRILNLLTDLSTVQVLYFKTYIT